MLSLAERVYRTIQRYDLFPPDARTVVAVSGGADSTALAHLLSDLAPRARFSLAALVHVNHQLRGAASDADETFCRDLAGRLGLPLEVGRVDVTAEARRLSTSIEDAGRQYRYQFLSAVADRLGASRIAVGHTRDDQAETVLLALIRGAGPRGLGGIRPRRGAIVRPLLEQRHLELLEWLRSQGYRHREDESNRDTRYLRNRVRHELLPLLENRFSPAIVDVLAREATIWDGDAEYLEGVATRALAAATSGETDSTLALDQAALLRQPRAIGRRVARLALRRVAGDSRFVGFDHAERLLELAGGEAKGPMALPGQDAAVQDGQVVLVRRPNPRPGFPTPAVNFSGVSLSIPGEALFPGTRLVISAELRTAVGGAPGPFDPDPRTATIDAATVSGLVVRGRRPGDRFRPLGLSGRKTLQDFFVDRKVPRGDRDLTPLVVDDSGRIVWVAGHAIGEDFRVSQGTHDVVILKLRGERV